MYRRLPDSELAVIPGTSHGLLHEKPGLCNTTIIEFLTADPIPTIAPIRRATEPEPDGRTVLRDAGKASDGGRANGQVLRSHRHRHRGDPEPLSRRLLMRCGSRLASKDRRLVHAQ